MRKLLVIADDSPEAETALKFAALRAKNTGASVTILSVVSPTTFEHWAGVREEVAREAKSTAEHVVGHFTSLAQNMADITPDAIYREGDFKSELAATIADDPDIKILILAANPDRKKGPGPLIAALTKDGLFTDHALPVVVVPGLITEEELHAIAS